MEYVYAAMLLYSAGKEITALAIKKILIATGFKPDPDRIKCLISCLKGIDIDEAIKSIQWSKAVEKPAEEPKKEAKEEKKKEEEEVEGLGKLFGGS